MTFALWLFMCFGFGVGCSTLAKELNLPIWVGAIIAGSVSMVLAAAFMEAFK